MTMPTDAPTACAVNRFMMGQSDYCDWADRVIVELHEDNRRWRNRFFAAFGFAAMSLFAQIVTVVMRVANAD